MTDPRDTATVRAASGLPAPRFWRSRSDKVFGGVLGGLAEKLGVEPRPLRILYTLFTIGTGGLLAVPYVAMWAITEPHGQPDRPPPTRPIWRSRSNRVIAGVMGGLAEKYDIDATLLRVLYVALSIFSAGFPGILIYLVLWIIARPDELPRQ